MLEPSTISATVTVHGERKSPLRLVWHFDGDRLTCEWTTALAEQLPTTEHLRPVA